MWTKTIMPVTAQQAVDALREEKGCAVVIGGGTDLVPQYRQRKIDLPCLVDVTRIEGFDALETDGGELVLGGAVTHAMAAASPLVRRYAAALAQGCAAVGSPQIRNAGTLAGNIVNAQPAADGVIPLVALDAQVTIAGPNGLRTLPILELYEGVGQSRLDHSSEVLCAIRFARLDTARGEGSATERLALRRALALPMVNVAAALGLDSGRFTWARLAVGPVAVTPFRAPDLETQLAGAPANDATIAEFAAELGRRVSPRDSALRGSADYRKAMVEVLARRAMQRACRAAQGEVPA